MKDVKILHMAQRRTQVDPNGPLAVALKELAELEIVEQGKTLAEDDIVTQMRAADIVITNWASTPIPQALVEDPGRLKYVLNIGGTCKATVSLELIQRGIVVTNWGDTPARSLAEGAVSLLFGVLKDLRGRVEGLRDGKGNTAGGLDLPSGSLNGLKMGLYGCGVIGSRFVEMLRPFNPELFVFDPYATSVPEGCQRVETITELFEESEAIAVWAGLSEETEGSVTAELLAKLPDHGIVINAARGEIIDQEALFAELKTGRLRAGLDVLVADNYLPMGHEAHTWQNLLITGHDINCAHWPKRPPSLGYAGGIAVENVRRFIAGEEMRFVMDETRYLRSS